MKTQIYSMCDTDTMVDRFYASCPSVGSLRTTHAAWDISGVTSMVPCLAVSSEPKHSRKKSSVPLHSFSNASSSLWVAGKHSLSFELHHYAPDVPKLCVWQKLRRIWEASIPLAPSCGVQTAIYVSLHRLMVGLSNHSMPSG